MISTHVLDTSRGTPAAGLAVALEVRDGGGWRLVGRGVTDRDGRIAKFSEAALASGTYRLTFDTAAYHRGAGVQPFFPEVAVTFELQGGERCHVPLLLNPFGYSTYRGT